MADSTHEAIWDWLRTCPEIADLFFNFSQSANGDTILIPLAVYSDTLVKEYIDGSADRQYDFTLVRFDACTTEPNSTQNIEVLCNFEAIAAWIEETAEAGNLPAFPAGSTITEIKALPSNIGYVAARDETGAKYMIQFRIEYLKEA